LTNPDFKFSKFLFVTLKGNLHNLFYIIFKSLNNYNQVKLTPLFLMHKTGTMLFTKEDFCLIVKQFKNREEDVAYIKTIFQKSRNLCSSSCQREIVARLFQKDRQRREIEDKFLTKYKGLEIGDTKNKQ